MLLWRCSRLSQRAAMSSWPQGRATASRGARQPGYGSQSGGQRPGDEGSEMPGLLVWEKGRWCWEMIVGRGDQPWPLVLGELVNEGSVLMTGGLWLSLVLTKEKGRLQQVKRGRTMAGLAKEKASFDFRENQRKRGAAASQRRRTFLLGFLPFFSLLFPSNFSVSPRVHLFLLLVKCFSPAPFYVHCSLVFIGKVLLGFQTSLSTFLFLSVLFFFCKF